MNELINQYHRVSSRRIWGFSRKTAEAVNSLEMRNICYDIRMCIRRKIDEKNAAAWIAANQ